MTNVKFYVFLDRAHESADVDGPRFATWEGPVDWLGAPRQGDSWTHCGEWTAEFFDQVSFDGPLHGKTSMALEVRTDPEVMGHLIAEHGFTG